MAKGANKKAAAAAPGLELSAPANSAQTLQVMLTAQLASVPVKYSAGPTLSLAAGAAPAHTTAAASCLRVALAAPEKAVQLAPADSARWAEWAAISWAQRACVAGGDGCRAVETGAGVAALKELVRRDGASALGERRSIL